MILIRQHVIDGFTSKIYKDDSVITEILDNYGNQITFQLWDMSDLEYCFEKIKHCIGLEISGNYIVNNFTVSKPSALTAYSNIAHSSGTLKVDHSRVEGALYLMTSLKKFAKALLRNDSNYETV